MEMGARGRWVAQHHRCPNLSANGLRKLVMSVSRKPKPSHGCSERVSRRESMGAIVIRHVIDLPLAAWHLGRRKPILETLESVCGGGRPVGSASVARCWFDSPSKWAVAAESRSLDARMALLPSSAHRKVRPEFHPSLTSSFELAFLLVCLLGWPFDQLCSVSPQRKGS